MRFRLFALGVADLLFLSERPNSIKIKWVIEIRK